MTARLRLPHSLEAPRVARRAVHEACSSAGITNGREHDAELLVSELVTNAVRHTSSDVELEWDVEPEELVIAVRDEDPEPAVAPSPIDLGAEGGRGLRLVASLADRWGVDRDRNGKSVWFTLLRR